MLHNYQLYMTYYSTANTLIEQSNSLQQLTKVIRIIDIRNPFEGFYVNVNITLHVNYQFATRYEVSDGEGKGGRGLITTESRVIK